MKTTIGNIIIVSLLLIFGIVLTIDICIIGSRIINHNPIPDSCRIQYEAADTIILYDTIYRQVVKPDTNVIHVKKEEAIVKHVPDWFWDDTVSQNLRANTIMLEDTFIIQTNKGDFIIYALTRKHPLYE